MTRIVGIIPARMGSSRFPGKPLANLLGRPMLEHVYRRTAACGLLEEVLVATCDEEIALAARGFGARAVMTSAAHVRASERVAEANSKSAADIVVMVQGDEPMIRPSMIEAATRPVLEDPAIGCVNLASPIRSEAELRDPNVIKVAIDRGGRALFFSREPIPTMGSRPFRVGDWFKQVCVISFRREALERFAALPPGPLEEAESVDMLRFLENGLEVHMVSIDVATHAVDTPADLERVASMMGNDASNGVDGRGRWS